MVQTAQCGEQHSMHGHIHSVGVDSILVSSLVFHASQVVNG